MKKIYLFLSTLLLVGGVYAQSQRVMLFEEFTGEDCGPCAATNPSLNALLKDNDGSVVPLKYQSIVSSSSRNVLYSQTSSESNARGNYYSNTSLPFGILDGNVKSEHAADFSQTDFDNRFSVASSFNLSVSHDFSYAADSIYITVNIEASQAFTAQKPASLKLRVAMVEREIMLTQPALNGEIEFFDVMRKMYPNPAGTTLSQNWTNGQIQTVTFGVKIPAYIFDKNQIAVVAFIQDDNNKVVEQAARSAQKQVRVDAKIADKQIPFLNCNAPNFVPSVTIKNNGSETLTNLDLDVKIDGNFSFTQSWSGNLASGAQTVATLDPIAKISGAHTIQIIAKSPNYEDDQNVFNDTTVGTFSFPDAAVPFPIAEDFESGIPTSFLIENPDLSLTWKDAAYSANGTGAKSAYIRFYAIPDGSVDYLYLPTLNLTGADFAKLTFDRAHVRYSNSFEDGCDIEGSKDCGNTWVKLWSKKGADLATSANSKNEFKPTASQWAADAASLDYFAGEPEVFVRFKAISNYGNNLYIDNLNVESTLTTNGGPQKPTGIAPISFANNISLYPNPAKNALSVSFGETLSTATVRVFDLRGAEVFNNTIQNSSELHLNTTSFQSGLYTIQISNGGMSAKKSFIVQH